MMVTITERPAAADLVDSKLVTACDKHCVSSITAMCDPVLYSMLSGSETAAPCALCTIVGCIGRGQECVNPAMSTRFEVRRLPKCHPVYLATHVADMTFVGSYCV